MAHEAQAHEARRQHHRGSHSAGAALRRAAERAALRARRARGDREAAPHRGDRAHRPGSVGCRGAGRDGPFGTPRIRVHRFAHARGSVVVRRRAGGRLERACQREGHAGGWRGGRPRVRAHREPDRGPGAPGTRRAHGQHPARHARRRGPDARRGARAGEGRIRSRGRRARGEAERARPGTHRQGLQAGLRRPARCRCAPHRHVRRARGDAARHRREAARARWIRRGEAERAGGSRRHGRCPRRRQSSRRRESRESPPARSR